MIEYETLVIESFKDEIVNQYIKENFVEILNKQFNKDNLNPEDFIGKYEEYKEKNRPQNTFDYRKIQTEKKKFIPNSMQIEILEKSDKVDDRKVPGYRK